MDRSSFKSESGVLIPFQTKFMILVLYLVAMISSFVMMGVGRTLIGVYTTGFLTAQAAVN